MSTKKLGTGLTCLQQQVMERKQKAFADQFKKVVEKKKEKKRKTTAKLFALHISPTRMAIAKLFALHATAMAKYILNKSLRF